MDYGYKRCSTTEEKQNPQRQLMHLKLDRVFVEFMSGKNEDRPQYQKLLSLLKEGDHVYFNEISRAGRNTGQLLATLEQLIKKHVTIHFVTEGLTFSDDDGQPMQKAMTKLLLQIISAVNEMFLAQTSEAIKQGQQRAREEGKLFGAANPKYRRKKSVNTRRRNEAIQRALPFKEPILMAAKLITEKVTYQVLANKLTLLAIPLPSGVAGVWQAAQVKRVVDRLGIKGELDEIKNQ